MNLHFLELEKVLGQPEEHQQWHQKIYIPLFSMLIRPDKKFGILPVALLLAFSLTAQPEKKIQCILKGEIEGRNSKALLLSKRTDNIHFEKIRIPIQGKTFSHVLVTAHEEAYQLIFEDEVEKGGWSPIVFFAEEGTITFKLHAQEDFRKNTVEGGKLNDAYTLFNKKTDDLFQAELDRLISIQHELVKNDEYRSDELKALLKETRQAKGDHEKLTPIYQKMDELEKTGRDLTDKGATWMRAYDSLDKVKMKWKYERINEADPSIASYYMLVNDLYAAKDKQFATNLIGETFPRFEKQYPEHPYTGRVSKELLGRVSIKPGGKYIDFTAPTLEGKDIRISEIIHDKVGLIVLWGSWCGPCIVKARKVVPLYNQFKDKGLAVVGIAREFKSTNALKLRLGKEEFSWTNLIELDDKNGIWSKYGVSNGAGVMVLVDKDGTVLAIDPKPEELQKTLSEKLAH